ncbi:MAG: hypothetical protein ACLUO4_01235 [Christensenellales bacterium]
MLNIVKKEEPSRGRAFDKADRCGGGFGATGLIMMFLGLNPFTVYVKMVEGATGVLSFAGNHQQNHSAAGAVAGHGGGV